MVYGPKSKLILQSATETNTSRGVSKSWSNVKYIEGVLTSAKGREAQLQDKTTVIATHVFFCDYDSNIDEKKRFLLGTRIFDILLNENPGNCNHHLEVLLKEVR